MWFSKPERTMQTAAALGALAVMAGAFGGHVIDRFMPPSDVRGVSNSRQIPFLARISLIAHCHCAMAGTRKHLAGPLRFAVYCGLCVIFWKLIHLNADELAFSGYHYAFWRFSLYFGLVVLDTSF
jgi:uncharacterized membrane protein YgdD (TMEM256/DUF423 family)